MKRVLIVIILLIAAAGFADELTIYQTARGGFGLVHASQNVQLHKGVNQVVLENLTHVPKYNSFLLNNVDEDLQLLSLDRNYNINNAYDLYNIARNKQVTVTLTHGEPVIGTLISRRPQGLVVRDSNTGKIHIIKDNRVVDFVINDLDVDDEDFASTIGISLYSAQEQNLNLDFSYLTDGINWEAVYQAVWDDNSKKLKISCQTELTNNTGKDFMDTPIKLVAGDVQAIDNNIYSRQGGAVDMENMAAMKVGGAAMAELSAFHIYKLNNRVDLPQSSKKQFQLYPEAELIAEDYYYLQNIFAGRALQKTITFDNSPENKLGMPLPEGIIKVYSPDTFDGQLQFIGDSYLNNTPKNRKVIITLGNAFDVTADARIVESRYNSAKKEVIARDMEIILHNDSSREARILIHHNLQYKLKNIKKENFNYSKIDDNTIEIDLKIPAESQKTLNWTED